MHPSYLGRWRDASGCNFGKLLFTSPAILFSIILEWETRVMLDTFQHRLRLSRASTEQSKVDWWQTSHSLPSSFLIHHAPPCVHESLSVENIFERCSCVYFLCAVLESIGCWLPAPRRLPRSQRNENTAKCVKELERFSVSTRAKATWFSSWCLHCKNMQQVVCWDCNERRHPTPQTLCSK